MFQSRRGHLQAGEQRSVGHAAWQENMWKTTATDQKNLSALWPQLAGIEALSHAHFCKNDENDDRVAAFFDFSRIW